MRHTSTLQKVTKSMQNINYTRHVGAQRRKDGEMRLSEIGHRPAHNGNGQHVVFEEAHQRGWLENLGRHK